ncbi:molybdopterin-containing oxidoreductase family protein [Nitrosophilus alvini]|uniref:molybdopterin-containing oxidoreductase family protein n=1 Tax=Nitrosophilus alvini TaxID=2714855 RepID=UPI001909AFD0|nr:molybdopterin-dependent oxidoreductase [Nitrosophilus alvini]
MAEKIKTACPLDCYDACSVIYMDGKLKGDKNHPVTRGFLCPHLNNYHKYKVLEKPKFRGKEISLEKAVSILAEKLKSVKPENVLHFRGSGNLGKMQEVTDLFFAKYGAVLTKGSLCDAAGQLGIENGRGRNIILPVEQIEKSELVVVWGRNIPVTNSHMLPFLKDKIIAVIDPIKTDFAKRANIHLQINPGTDLELANMMARFTIMQNEEAEEFVEEFCEDFDYYYDYLKSFRIVRTVEKIGVDILEIMTLQELMKDLKTVFLVGNGVQKYSNGTDTIRAIDSLAATLGLFGKEGCGVSFLGDTSAGLENPFAVEAKRVNKAVVDFGNYDLCFIQGANPANQNPASKDVREGLEKSFTVYFGLYENETSELSDLVIPAKNFLQKSDMRFSYGHEYVSFLPKIEENENALSEYELTKKLFDIFGFEGLKSEEEYLNIFKSQLIEEEGLYKIPVYEKIPYKEGFYTDEEKFLFIEESEEGSLHEKEGLWLITPKSKKSLNSQFEREKYAYLHPSLGIKEGEKVKISSEYGEYIFETKIDDSLKENTVLIYSGTAGVNFITPRKTDEYGNGAVFQEVKLKIERV